MLSLYIYGTVEGAILFSSAGFGLDMITDGHLTIAVLGLALGLGGVAGFTAAWSLSKVFVWRSLYLSLWIATAISTWTLGGLIYDLWSFSHTDTRIVLAETTLASLPGVAIGGLLCYWFYRAAKPLPVAAADFGPTAAFRPSLDFETADAGGPAIQIPLAEGYLPLPESEIADALLQTIHLQIQELKPKYSFAADEILPLADHVYVVKITLESETDTLTVYITCKLGYEQGQPPESVLLEVGDGHELPYQPTLLQRWSSAYTLETVLDDVCQQVRRFS